MNRHDVMPARQGIPGEMTVESHLAMFGIIEAEAEAEVAALFRRAPENAVNQSLSCAILEYRLEKQCLIRK